MPLLWNLLTGSISQQPIDLISPLMQKVHQGQMWYLPLKYRRISQIAHAERVRPSARTRYQPRRAEEKETVSGDWFCNLQRGLLYGTNWVRNVMCHFLWLHGSGCFCFFFTRILHFLFFLYILRPSCFTVNVCLFISQGRGLCIVWCSAFTRLHVSPRKPSIRNPFNNHRLHQQNQSREPAWESCTHGLFKCSFFFSSLTLTADTLLCLTNIGTILFLFSYFL